MLHHIIHTSLLVSMLGLSACGAGGSSTSAPTDPVPTESIPTAAKTVSLAVSGKSLDFSWTAGDNVDHYRISVNPDGVSGFTVDPAASNIINSATNHSIEIPVHKTNWLAAQYIVEACDATESVCVASPNQTLSLIDSVSATIYVKASNSQATDLFGFSTTLSGDGNTLAVGAYVESSSAIGINGDQTSNAASNSGAVYVFSKVGSVWQQQSYIKASNVNANDQFGYSVSLSDDGNTLAVGANRERSSAVGIGGNQIDNTMTAAGAVYVFSRTESTWAQQAYIKASNTEAGDEFGWSLSLSGDGHTLAVGAELEDSVAVGVGGNQMDNSASGAGAVYVFLRTGSTWSQQAYVKASNTDASDRFGWSLSLSGDGDTLAVGAVREDSAATGINGNQADNTVGTAGAVYVFSRNGVVWSQQAYVKASNTGGVDQFGSVVSLNGDGNTLAVGAFREDSSATGINGIQSDNSKGESGAVYVFTRTGLVWSQQAYIKASNTRGTDYFGSAVALNDDGNTLAVGAYFEDSNAVGIDGGQFDTSAVTSGAVFVFTRNLSTWTQKSYVKASNTGSGDQFGYSVSLSDDGDTLAVGGDRERSLATGINGNQQDDAAFAAGAVYLY